MKYFKLAIAIIILTASVSANATTNINTETKLHTTNSLYNDYAKNNFYIELGGNGGFYSINYERLLSESILARVGFSYLRVNIENSNGTFLSNGSLITVPVTISKLFGESNHKLEVGAGATIYKVSASTSHNDPVVQDTFGSDKLKAKATGIIPTAVLGYRYQPEDGGLMFKASFTPMYSNGTFLPWAGVGIGYSF